MRCHICDSELSEKEIVWDEDVKGYEPCAVCLDIIYDAAFSDGFSRDSSDIIVVASIEDTDPLGPDGGIITHSDLFGGEYD